MSIVTIYSEQLRQETFVRDLGRVKVEVDLSRQISPNHEAFEELGRQGLEKTIISRGKKKTTLQHYLPIRCASLMPVTHSGIMEVD